MLPVLLIAVLSTTVIVEAAQQTLAVLIVTKPSTSILAAPQAKAATVTKVKLGEFLNAIEKQQNWYKVQLPNQKVGWIEAKSVREFKEDLAQQTYLDIAKYYNNELSFLHTIEYIDFLSRAIAETTAKDVLAELELTKFLAIGNAASQIELDKANRPPYKGFLKQYEKILVYSEPGGIWLLKSDVLWQLHKKYATLGTGEKIAWAAAENPLPGECEGDLLCNLHYFRQTQGRYLALYPKGPKASGALQNLRETLREGLSVNLQDYKLDNKEEKAETLKLLNELIDIVSKLPFENKDVIGMLRKLADSL
ncbi:MAG: SH3 domain-containing protein [Acidobacteriota bacterium]|nr:SH3 domain-containing protein [Blastocatellia bacterium]MDW8411269.1 SH3 domain-containing protein [Acidobacteriota bacterium]